MTLAIEKEPATRAPWPPLAENDTLFRHPKPHPLHKNKKEWFGSIAKLYAVGPLELIKYNFLTKDPKEINWYLREYVGCDQLSPDRRSYSFVGLEHDEASNRGVVYIPRFGDSVTEHVNRLGQQVVEGYNGTNNKRPQGRCYEVCYARVRNATLKSDGFTLPAFNADDPFVALFGSLISSKKWKDTPEEYRGMGAAGAMAWKGWGDLVTMHEIWAGKLKPGAVIQTWSDAADFDRVNKSEAPMSYGHSFIFMHYARKNNVIAGLVIADQGYQNGKPLAKGDYGYWVAANLKSGAAK